MSMWTDFEQDAVQQKRRGRRTFLMVIVVATVGVLILVALFVGLQLGATHVPELFHWGAWRASAR